MKTKHRIAAALMALMLLAGCVATLPGDEPPTAQSVATRTPASATQSAQGATATPAPTATPTATPVATPTPAPQTLLAPQLTALETHTSDEAERQSIAVIATWCNAINRKDWQVANQLAAPDITSAYTTQDGAPRNMRLLGVESIVQDGTRVMGDAALQVDSRDGEPMFLIARYVIQTDSDTPFLQEFRIRDDLGDDVLDYAGETIAARSKFRFNASDLSAYLRLPASLVWTTPQRVAAPDGTWSIAWPAGGTAVAYPADDASSPLQDAVLLSVEMDATTSRRYYLYVHRQEGTLDAALDALPASIDTREEAEFSAMQGWRVRAQGSAPWGGASMAYNGYVVANDTHTFTIMVLSAPADEAAAWRKFAPSLASFQTGPATKQEG